MFSGNGWCPAKHDLLTSNTVDNDGHTGLISWASANATSHDMRVEESILRSCRSEAAKLLTVHLQGFPLFKDQHSSSVCLSCQTCVRIGERLSVGIQQGITEPETI